MCVRPPSPGTPVTTTTPQRPSPSAALTLRTTSIDGNGSPSPGPRTSRPSDVRAMSGRDGFGELLDADGGRLELRRARLRIDGVDRQEVRGDVVLEMERHER